MRRFLSMPRWLRAPARRRKRANLVAAPRLVEPLESRQLLSLTIDVQLAGGGKSTQITSVGQVIDLDVFAVVTGSDNDGANDGLQIAAGNFLSTDILGGAAAGKFAVTLDPTFSNLGASAGKAQDLDGDGDADRGSNNASSSDDYFAVRAVFDPRTGGTVDGGTHTFKIATLKFTVTSLRPGDSTLINFAYRPDQNSPLWIEDNQIRQPRSEGSVVTVGEPVVLEGNPQADTQSPTASLNTSNIATGGGETHTFIVTYSDDIAIDVSTINSSDLRVTGPNGYSVLAQRIDVSSDIDGTPRTGTYRIAAPGGFWDFSDNGTYTVTMQGNQVRDIFAKSVAAGSLGTFTVQAPSVVKAPDGRLIVTGTPGNNTITVSSINKGSTIRATIDGKNTDVATSGVTRVVIAGNDGNDHITVSVNLPASIDGGVGNDTLRGSGGFDTLGGGAGNDQLFGGAGNDTLKGGADNDGLAGEAGNDNLDGGTGTDSLLGGDGNDTLKGSDDNDTLNGDAGNDHLDGGAANDPLFGGEGNDTLKGADGNDALRGENGNDRLDGGLGSDGFFGGPGTDTADYSSRTKRLRINIDGKAGDGETVENDNVRTDVENLLGGAANDVLRGSSANNSIHGNGGNDVINGGAGNDSLTGGAGTDKLFGDDGNDLLTSNNDNVIDTLNGGAGTDSARLDNNDVRSKIETIL